MLRQFVFSTKIYNKYSFVTTVLAKIRSFNGKILIIFEDKFHYVKEKKTISKSQNCYMESIGCVVC